MVTAIAILLAALVTNMPNSTSGSRLGVAMLNILGFSQSLAQFIFFYTDLETSLQAVSRVKEFVSTAVSDEPDASSLIQPPVSWPSRGAVEFHDTTASYTSDPSDPSHNVPALQDLSLTIPPRPESRDLRPHRQRQVQPALCPVSHARAQQRKHHRRRTQPAPRVPQDRADTPGCHPPQVQSGTIWRRAKPKLRPKPDSDLKLTPLHPTARSSPRSQKSGCGSRYTAAADWTPTWTWSRSHMASSRTFAWRRRCCGAARSFVLDEATSHVDWATDELVQRVICAEFTQRTIVTVAHRLRTILDSDVVAVLGKGRGGCWRRGHPGELLARAGPFRELCGVQGIAVDSISEGMGVYLSPNGR